MNKEELIKELSLEVEDNPYGEQSGHLDAEMYHAYEAGYKKAVEDVISNPKILIKKDDQSLPENPYIPKGRGIKMTYMSESLKGKIAGFKKAIELANKKKFVAAIPFNEMEE